MTHSPRDNDKPTKLVWSASLDWDLIPRSKAAVEAKLPYRLWVVFETKYPVEHVLHECCLWLSNFFFVPSTCALLSSEIFWPVHGVESGIMLDESSWRFTISTVPISKSRGLVSVKKNTTQLFSLLFSSFMLSSMIAGMPHASHSMPWWRLWAWFRNAKGWTSKCHTVILRLYLKRILKNEETSRYWWQLTSDLVADPMERHSRDLIAIHPLSCRRDKNLPLQVRAQRIVCLIHWDHKNRQGLLPKRQMYILCTC